MMDERIYCLTQSRLFENRTHSDGKTFNMNPITAVDLLVYLKTLPFSLTQGILEMRPKFNSGMWSFVTVVLSFVQRTYYSPHDGWHSLTSR